MKLTGEGIYELRDGKMPFDSFDVEYVRLDDSGVIVVPRLGLRNKVVVEFPERHMAALESLHFTGFEGWFKVELT